MASFIIPLSRQSTDMITHMVLEIISTGTCLIASRIFISQIFILHFDILNIPLVLKLKSGNWKMETIRSSSRQLQASITALVFFQLISTFAVNDFLCVFCSGIKVKGKLLNKN